MLASVIPKPTADTQSGFIVASAGKDGQFGTSDDIYVTEKGDMVKSAVDTAKYDMTKAVPSGIKKSIGNIVREPQPLRQPNSDEIPIRTPEELAKIGVDPNYSLNGKYILMANLDLSGYSNWMPIGVFGNPFTGTFDGNGLVIKNLTINRPTNDYQALFGRTSGAKLMNIKLENVNVTGHNYTGGLVGYNYCSTITNCYSTGSVTGNDRTGGLVGEFYSDFKSSITNCYSTGNVTGNNYTGGLVG
ncbi:GLUG motif-containing protein, partial [Caldanaerobius fijiensis]